MKKLFLALFTTLIIFSCYGVLQMEASTAAMHKEIVTVRSGDTLWQVASQWTGRGEDVREVIYRIEAENKIQNRNYLQPGQKLVVPVRKTSSMLAKK